jgi:Flp pilus assembly protein TadG
MRDVTVIGVSDMERKIEQIAMTVGWPIMGLNTRLKQTVFKPVRRFRRDEKGGMLIFALLCFMGMLVGAGMAIDFMRYENNRSRMQATLDRAILAAAALNQPLDAEAVVIDYFAKSGLKDYTLTISVDEGVNFRTVNASAALTQNSLFLNMVGIDTLSVITAGIAEERIQKLEVSLVLDVSGSMGSNSKLANLKVAAKDFAQALIDAGRVGKVAISIIPYNGTVVVGSRLAQEYNLTVEHNASTCVRFDDEDFFTTTLSTSQSIERVAHFDYQNSGRSSPIAWPECDTGTDSAILPFSTSIAAINAHIDGLSAGGMTASDIGMKWGVSLLDPSARDVLTNLIASDDADPLLADRPVAYSDGDTLKVIILMTDGDNTNQYDIIQERKSGLSDVWLDHDAPSGSTTKYSVYDTDREEYYYPHDRTWHATALGGNPVQMTYPELWGTFSTRYVGSYFYRYSRSKRNDMQNSYELTAGGNLSDERLSNMCSAAKNAEIMVFTIGFEAPIHGQSVMRSCATSPAYFYDVDGLEIADAFNSIVVTIQKIKLVQ